MHITLILKLYILEALMTRYIYLQKYVIFCILLFSFKIIFGQLSMPISKKCDIIMFNVK